MGHINEIEQSNLSSRQFDTVRAKLMGMSDRMCDAQVLELADALHEVLRARQRIRCQHSRVGGGMRLTETRVF